MIFDYVTGPPGTLQYPIYGHLIPVNEIGYLFILLAMLPAIAASLLQNTLREQRLQFLIFFAALVAYAGAYISSCRWLDDLFVNLAHSYNLFHHGRFSVSPSHMVNGTVEIAYYLLLTPFAKTKASLIIADYTLGFLIGALHLWLFSKLLRPFQPTARLISLLAFSVSIPLIQSFSGGYGNGLVSLVTFIGILAVFEKRISLIYMSCALLPLLRPDALIYSFALVLADLMTNKRVRPICWIPTILSTTLYFLAIKTMYGVWIPTPMLLKSVALGQILRDLPSVSVKLFLYFCNSPRHLCYTILTILFFCLKIPLYTSLTRRKAFAWFISMLPILVFYAASLGTGYNPTSRRYYMGVELVLTVIALINVARIIQYVLEALSNKTPVKFGVAGFSQMLNISGSVILSCLLLAGMSFATVESLKQDDGESIGIQLGSWDLKRLSTLAFAGQYCASVIPQGWRIASTEMDTFGMFSGREILDLWGYSNRGIAQSKRIDRYGIKNNPNVFLDSDVEVFWLRTIGKVDSKRPEYRIGIYDRQLLPKILANFPNLSKQVNQVGDLNQVFHKYDIVRVAHGGQYITVFLVRKDLTTQFRTALKRKGHKLIGASQFGFQALDTAYATQRY